MSAERWRDVVGYEGAYEVSSLGRVRSKDRRTSHGRSRRAQLLAPARVRDGYLAVQLWTGGVGRMRGVAGLVAEAFIGPRPGGMQVCHCDGQRTNNRVENLRYDSAAGNQGDRIRHGTHCRGERSPNARLTRERAHAIRQSAEPDASLAQRFGVSRKAVWLVRRNRTWVEAADAL